MALARKDLWRIERATRMSVIVDADDYFRHARAAMLKARRRIMLIGWDFDARIRLVEGDREPGEPDRIGEFIYWLVERSPQLEVYLLRWDVGALKAVGRGSTALTVLKWVMHKRIHARLDGRHPTGASHHQKIVAIDDCFAFCGGIDVTAARWDTREHRDDDPGRLLPSGKPYKPWHDATSAVQGPVAAALGDLARERWRRAGGGELATIPGIDDCWPDDLVADFEDVDVGIARTFPKMDDQDEVREIEALFVSQIASAKRRIYAESQYFASRRVAEAIAARLAEDDGPEIVIINPETSEGWLPPLAMDTARARLVTALRQLDRHDRLRIYHPFTTAGEPIYVHAKIMVVDGQALRIGSANMNNRSMGLDTECDLLLAANGKERAAAAIHAIECGLIAEHLGVAAERVADALADDGSLIAAIEALRGAGHSLRPYEVKDVAAIEAWLADNAVLDPESPSELFETAAPTGLFRGRLRRPWR